MSGMFQGATSFKHPIGGWDKSAVTDMRYMFKGAAAFNQDLSTWDVSGVTDMTRVFYHAVAFNGNISTWDVSSCWGSSIQLNIALNALRNPSTV